MKNAIKLTYVKIEETGRDRSFLPVSSFHRTKKKRKETVRSRDRQGERERKGDREGEIREARERH